MSSWRKVGRAWIGSIGYELREDLFDGGVHFLAGVFVGRR